MIVDAARHFLTEAGKGWTRADVAYCPLICGDKGRGGHVRQPVSDGTTSVSTKDQVGVSSGTRRAPRRITLKSGIFTIPDIKTQHDTFQQSKA